MWHDPADTVSDGQTVPHSSSKVAVTNNKDAGGSCPFQISSETVKDAARRLRVPLVFTFTGIIFIFTGLFRACSNL